MQQQLQDLPIGESDITKLLTGNFTSVDKTNMYTRWHVNQVNIFYHAHGGLAKVHYFLPKKVAF